LIIASSRRKGLLSLGNLKKLRSLSIFPSTATAVRGCAKAGVLFATWYCEDEQGDSFANSQEVRKLYCDETFGDEALAACRFPQLRTVSLPPQATDKTLACLAAWPELESLTVRSPHVSNASLKAICNATKLRRLDLRGTSITARGLAELKKLKHLQELVPPQSNLAMLQALQEAQLLPLLAHREVRGTTLDLNGKRTTNASLELLDDQLNVQTIILDVSQITDAGLKHLAKNKSVQEISLNSAMRLRGMEFQELAVLPKLQVLRLIYTDIDDRAGDGLATLTSLRELELNHTKVTAAIVPQAPPAGAPDPSSAVGQGAR
jgi:Leucine-rich repeat (LRR) protein